MKQINTRFTLLKNQSGINMVDLMMWLVIAALLLAAAIQSIGYYQKAAYLNNIKLAAHDAGTNSLAVAANTKGVVDKKTVTTAASDTKWTQGTSYSIEGDSASPYIRVTDPSVTDQEVIYLFESCGDYAVGVNVVPVGGTPELADCGVSPAAPATGGETGGSVNGEEVSNILPETAEAISYTPITDTASGVNPVVIQYLNTELRAYADKSIMEYDWDAFEATAISQEYYATYPRTTGAKNYTDYLNLTERTDDANITALASAYWTSYFAYGDAITAQKQRETADPSARNDLSLLRAAQKKQVDAMSAFYRASAALPIPTAPMVVSASDPNGLKDRTVAAGSAGMITFKYDTPASLNVAGNQSGFSGYSALNQKSAFAPNGTTSKSEYAVNGNALAVSAASVTLGTSWYPMNAWPAGESEMVVGVKNNQTNIIYYSTLKIIGQ